MEMNNLTRKARLKSESGIYHIILRGINRQDIFEDDEDRYRLLRTIDKYKLTGSYQVFAYCLMSNHIHLLIKEALDPISLIVKRISASYVFWFNDKYGRCGHLFQDRFKSEPIDNDLYFMTVLRYIHQNPLKAGLVGNVGDWKWSSYNDYFKKCTQIDTSYGLSMFPGDINNALSQFKLYLNESNEEKCIEYEEKPKVTDDKVRNYIISLGFNNISSLQHAEKTNRNDIIKKVKSLKGITIRQLSRVTGISKSVISKI